MPNPVVYFEVIGKDHKALSSFYSALFDWDVQPAGPGNYNFANPGDGISGGIGAFPGGEKSYQTFFVQVDDLHATLDKVKELGGSTLIEPMNVAEDTDVAVFQDPEDHVIGIVARSTS
ncbi:MAG: VOC family protein [Thermoleophilaceae bacterium]